MIRALLDFYEYLLDTGLAEEQFGWAEMAVPMTLDVDSEGKVLSLKSNVYTEKNEKGKEQQIVPRMLLPYHPVRSNNILACIFADKAEYLLGIGPRGDKAFAAMKSLQEKLLGDVDSPVAKGILRFFGTWDLSSASDKFSES